MLADKGWADRSDRDLTVAGRYSRRFYNFATRWMVSEVALHRQQHSEKRSYPRMARNFVSAKVGRLGMLLTEREVERV